MFNDRSKNKFLLGGGIIGFVIGFNIGLMILRKDITKLLMLISVLVNVSGLLTVFFVSRGE